TVRVSAKADYAIRAMVELAAAGGGPLKAERIAQAQEIPLKFLENIMTDLRQGALVRSQRGAEGGYWLARPADEITLAQVIRAVEGPLANVRGRRSEEVEFAGSAAPLREVWVAVRASLRAVLESVTLADVARGELPDAVAGLTADADAWLPHRPFQPPPGSDPGHGPARRSRLAGGADLVGVTFPATSGVRPWTRPGKTVTACRGRRSRRRARCRRGARRRGGAGAARAGS